MRERIIWILILQFIAFTSIMGNVKERNVEEIFQELAKHAFHPLNDENSMTTDRKLGKDGIADLNNIDWKVRLLAVRDLVGIGSEKADALTNGLHHSSPHVRQVTAKALGILRATHAIDALEEVVKNDSIAMVRSQAVIALGQMEARQSVGLLKKSLEEDPSKDVRHQCELAIYQIENQMGVTKTNLKAWKELDETSFKTIKTGDAAPNFALEDTEGKTLQLSSFKNKKWVVLIWVFADWCPVCHGEFHDLMEMKQEFENEGVQVVTLEIHDTYRGRVMVGKELEPQYWFAKESFKDAYTNRIWWPHLLDRAGTLGVKFGVDPLAFAVHAEYINRPTTVIVDSEGTVRFIYRGTFWGDRPTIEETLEMIKNEKFEFEHKRRL